MIHSTCGCVRVRVYVEGEGRKREREREKEERRREIKLQKSGCKSNNMRMLNRLFFVSTNVPDMSNGISSIYICT